MAKQETTKRKQVAHAGDGADGNANGDETVQGRSELLQLPVEILGMIGELIPGRKSLQALVATCQSFRQIYEPFLYADLTYNLHKLNPVRPRYIELPPGVSHIKELNIHVDEFGTERRPGVMYDPKSMNDNYARYLARLIKEAPGLLAFCWHCRSFDAPEIALILQNKTLMKALWSAPKLEKLCITFEALLSDDLDPPELAYQNSFISLKGFGNLTSLELYNLSDQKENLVEDIAAVLARSPKLSTLGLGLACYGEWEASPETIVYPDRCDFLEKLCVAYKTKSKDPLTIKMLRLGYAVCVLESESPECGNFLEFLFEPTQLRSLHIYNGYVQLRSTDDEYELAPIEWNLLKHCTSLHQLAVNMVGNDLRDWLNSTAKEFKELIFSDRNGMMHGRASQFLPTLEHSLSFLFAAEDGYNYPTRTYRDYEMESSDTPSSSSANSSNDSDSESSNLSRYGSSGLPSELRPHLMTPLGSKLVKIDDEAATVLDRLKDGGIHLNGLALSIDLEIQWKHFALRLETLKHLTYLRLMRRTWKSGPWPAKRNSKWEGVYEPKEIALKYAQLTKELCPSVQFVMIKDWVWQFILQPYPSKVDEDKRCSRFLAVELEWKEYTKIPMFAQDPLDTQGGLPMTDLEPPYVIDWAAQAAFNKFIKERMAAWRAENPHDDWDDFRVDTPLRLPH